MCKSAILSSGLGTQIENKNLYIYICIDICRYIYLHKMAFEPGFLDSTVSGAPVKPNREALRGDGEGRQGPQDDQGGRRASGKCLDHDLSMV